MSKPTTLTAAQLRATYSYRGIAVRGMTALGRLLAVGDYAGADRLLAAQALADAAAHARTNRPYCLHLIASRALDQGREWSYL